VTPLEACAAQRDNRLPMNLRPLMLLASFNKHYNQKDSMFVILAEEKKEKTRQTHLQAKSVRVFFSPRPVHRLHSTPSRRRLQL
jgi:hypothetical protein